eukprot:9332330-Pyramimonas_sp.AAC.1
MGGASRGQQLDCARDLHLPALHARETVSEWMGGCCQRRWTPGASTRALHRGGRQAGPPLQAGGAGAARGPLLARRAAQG